MSNIAMRRIIKELQQLERDPVEGLLVYALDASDSSSTHHQQQKPSLPTYEAKLSGPPSTPYENGTFTLKIIIPQRYPIEPPTISFTTRIYHPNIDDSGRICLDILKGAPKGKWKPSLSLRSVLISIQALMAEPNPDDWLMSDIANVYRDDRKRFNKTARDMTEKYAMKNRITVKGQEKNDDSKKEESAETSTEEKDSKIAAEQTVEASTTNKESK